MYSTLVTPAKHNAPVRLGLPGELLRTRVLAVLVPSRASCHEKSFTSTRRIFQLVPVRCGVLY